MASGAPPGGAPLGGTGESVRGPMGATEDEIVAVHDDRDDATRDQAERRMAGGELTAHQEEARHGAGAPEAGRGARTTPRRRSATWTVIGAGLVGAAGIGVWTWRRSRRAPKRATTRAWRALRSRVA